LLIPGTARQPLVTDGDWFARVRLRYRTAGKEPDVAGKKRPKSLVQPEKKVPAKPKRPKKTSRGK
jgi:hypothetical protein